MVKSLLFPIFAMTITLKRHIFMLLSDRKYYKHKPDIGRIIIKLEVIKDEKQGEENVYGPCPHCGNAIGKFMCYA